MLPPFDTNGNLPVGIHTTNLAEFEKRFAYTIIRKDLFSKLTLLINDLKTINCRTIYIDGSYVTNKRVPSDIDICWEDEFIDYEFAILMLPILNASKEKQFERYGADIYPANFIDTGSFKYFLDFYQYDTRTQLKKGIIKIEIL